MLVFIAIGVVVAGLLAIALIMANNWIKAEPNEVIILTGRKHLTKDASGNVVKRGWRMVTGGGILRIPILEKINRMSLLNMNIPDLTVTEAYSSQGVKVSIICVVNFKVSSIISMVELAIENFLGKPVEAMKQVVQETMEGQLRDVMATLTIEELYKNREAFITKVHEQATEELAKMGLVINNINIQSISDPNGYLDALGRERTAQVIRDAEIGEARAQRESTIETETAMREAAVVKAEQERQTAEAEKERDVAMKRYIGETAAAREKADQQGPLAKAEVEKEVVAAQERVKESQELARRDVEAAKALAEAELLNATVVVPAEAAKQEQIKIAEGEAEAIKKKAEASAYEVEIQGRAEGEAEKAKLTGEAEGTERMAQALNTYQESGKLKISLDAMVEVAKAGSVTLDNFVPERVIAFDGGGGGNGHGSLVNLATMGPVALTKFMESMSAAAGVNLLELIGQLNKDDEPVKVAVTSPVTGEQPESEKDEPKLKNPTSPVDPTDPLKEID